MAKKRGQPRDEQGGAEAGSSRSVEDAAIGFAEDLGRLLGTAERKANEWIGQRKEVVRQLTELREKAGQLLERLSGETAFPWNQGGKRRGARAGSSRASATESASGPDGAEARKGTRKRKGMSAAQRRAVGERMRKYWALRRKSEGR